MTLPLRGGASVPGLLRDAWERVVRFFSGRRVPGEGQLPDPGRVPHAGTPLPAGSAPGSPDDKACPLEGPAPGNAGSCLPSAPGSQPGTREGGAATADPSPPGNPATPPSATPEGPAALCRWTVREHAASPFEKCGRVFVSGDGLVIRSDLDPRGFFIPLTGVARVLDGESVPVLLLATGEPAGVATRSASGKAVNFRIGPFLYTTPLAKVRDVVEGRARKAAVFVGRGDWGR